MLEALVSNVAGRVKDFAGAVQEIRALDESRNVSSSLKPIYDRLTEIRRELESLVRGVWSARKR